MSIKKIITLLGIVVILLAILAIWPTKARMPSQWSTNGNNGPVACTMEAKLCPDGTAVGRQGPNCEFAPCPDVATSTQILKIYNSNGIGFMYPEKLVTTYITAVDWPPMIAVENHKLSCTTAGAINDRAGKTERRVINGRVYCVTTEGEGAAGSTYLNYAYATDINGKTVLLTFSIREVQCANYDEPKAGECITERNAFSMDPIVDSIVKTLQIS